MILLITYVLCSRNRDLTEWILIISFDWALLKFHSNKWSLDKWNYIVFYIYSRIVEVQ